MKFALSKIKRADLTAHSALWLRSGRGDGNSSYIAADRRRRSGAEAKHGSGGGFDMGMNKACDFQGAYVAFLERLDKDPKFPRFGGAKITSSCLSTLQFRIEIDLQ